MAPDIAGGCLCGAVRFRFDKPPEFSRVCWCRDCQYLSSGNASVSAIFATEGFRLTGKTAAYCSKSDSGSLIRRRFCPACGTPLFCEEVGKADFMVVRAGALDNPEIARPSCVIWISSAPSWACMDSGLPVHDRQPPTISDG